MPYSDNNLDGSNPLVRIQHDLKTPLTTIYARAQLLTRYVRRSSTVADADRVRLLNGLAEVEAATREMVARIDAISCPPCADGDR